MKATIDIPDELYRQVKARSALQGKAVREVTVELYERWLASDMSPAPAPDPERWLKDWLRDADAAIQAAPTAPSARIELQRDRGRLDRP
jgi:hypothetical protein